MQLDPKETLVAAILIAVVFIAFLWWIVPNPGQPSGADKLPTFELKR